MSHVILTMISNAIGKPMFVETVLSMLTLVCHVKKVMHRGWAYFQARLAFTMAAVNVLVQWHSLGAVAKQPCQKNSPSPVLREANVYGNWKSYFATSPLRPYASGFVPLSIAEFSL